MHVSLSQTLHKYIKNSALDNNVNWIKLDLTTIFICLSNLSEESKMTPMFFIGDQITQVTISDAGRMPKHNNLCFALIEMLKI